MENWSDGVVGPSSISTPLPRSVFDISDRDRSPNRSGAPFFVGANHLRTAQFPSRGQSNRRRAGYHRTLSAYSASDLHGSLPVHRGGGRRPFVLEISAGVRRGFR